MFSSKPRNKRFKRDQVLDVKLRSTQVRSARARRVSIFLQVVFLLGVLGIILWQGTHWALNHFIYENEFFAVRTLDVQTDGALEVDQLKRWANVQTQANLLALDLPRVKRDLELCPWIRLALVQRWLPGTVRIRIIERKPLAQVRAFHQRSDRGGYEQLTFHLDETGFVMLPLHEPLPYDLNTAEEQLEELPIITGLPESVLRVGKRAEAAQLQAALMLIQEFQRSPMFAHAELRHLDVSSPQVLQVNTTTGAEITFGLEQMDRQMQRWQSIHNYGLSIGKAILTLDLSVSNHIPARWTEWQTVPGIVPKPLRPVTVRKKYV